MKAYKLFRTVTISCNDNTYFLIFHHFFLLLLMKNKSIKINVNQVRDFSNILFFAILEIVVPTQFAPIFPV